MRATPIGLLPEVEAVLEYADIQARITHNTAAGAESTQAAALATHYCRYNLGPTHSVAT